MWIHLPRISSQSVPVSQASSWELAQFCQGLERSATWNAKSRPAKFWSRELGTGALTTLLSGQTLRHLTQGRGLDEYISSLAASPVRHFPLPENAGKRTTNETSSQRLSESPPDWDTQTSFWRTSEPPAAITMTPFDPNYERWITRLRRLSSQRQKSAHLTDENDSSSWPTPTLGGKESRASRAARGSGGEDLAAMVTNWPTPRSQEHFQGGEALEAYVDAGYRQPKTRGVKTTQGTFDTTLTTAVMARNWPTPATRDYKGFDPPGKTNAHQDPAMYLSSHLAQPIGMDGHTCSTKCRRLNQRFVQLLMGFPVGWTEPYAPLEMQLFRQWRERLGSYFQTNWPNDERR